MKRLILFLTLCVSFLLAKSQTWDPVKGRYEFQFTKNDSASAVPFDTLKSAPINSIAIKNGVMYMKAATTHWVSVTGGTSGATWGVNIGGTITEQSDLMALLGLKLNFSDTAHMLLNYQRSATAMKYADSASMLAPYLRSSLLNKTNLGLGNVLNSAQVINAGGATSMEVGTFASIPSVIGGPTWWFASDTVAWYYNNGSAYVKASGSGGGGGGGDDSTLMASKHFVSLNYYPLTGNPSAFLTSITSGQVITALGFTPYSNSNPSGFISANQVISFSPTGDVSTTGGSGSTSLTPAFTVTGLEGHALAALANGNLHYNTSGGWTFDNTTYLPFADAPIITRLGFRGDTLVRQNGFNFSELGLVDSSLGGIHHKLNSDGTITLYGDSVKFYAQYPLIAVNDTTFGIDTLATLGGGFNAIALQGFLFTASPTTSGQVPTFNGTSIIWTTPSGGGGGFPAITTPNGTINITGSGTSAVTLDFNPASNIAATGNWTYSAAPTPSGASSVNFGSGSLPWLTGFFNSIAAPANLALGVGSGHEIDLNVGSATKFSVLSTGQQSWFAYNANAFPGSTTADTVVVENGGKVKTIPITSFGLTGNPLSQFAATSSSQLASVISDETGTGLIVLNNAPTLLSPKLGASSTTGFIWTATDNVGNGSWQVNSGSGGGLAAVFGAGQIAIKGGDTVVKTDSVWYRGPAWGAGVAIAGNNLINLAESSPAYDTAQIITGLPSGTKVVRLWYTDDTLSYPHVGYAESITGAPGTWVGYSGDSVISGHYRGCVVKNGGFYYYYGVNKAETQVDVYVSPHGAPASWTLLSSAVITASGLSAVNIFNSWVFIESGTWYMMLDVGSGAFGFSEYGFTSTDGITWTAVTGNPIIPRGSGPWFTHVNGKWYYIGHSTMNSAILPSDIYTFSATAFTGPWNLVGNGSTIHRLTADEGVNTITGQIADPAPISIGDSSTLMFTTVTNNGNSSGGAFIKMLRSPLSLFQILTNNIPQNAPVDARLEALGNGDAVYNVGHIGIATEAPTAMFDIEPYPGIDSGYADGSAVNFLNDKSSSILNVGFNTRYSTFANWGQQDPTQVGYFTSYATSGVKFGFAAAGFHPTPLFMGGWLYNGTNGILAVGGFGTTGKLFFNSTTDVGDGSQLQMNGGAINAGNITGNNQFNGWYMYSGQGAIASNFAISISRPFQSSTTGTNNLALVTTMSTLTNGGSNVGIGSGALATPTTASFNTAVGTLALGGATVTNSFNTAVGRTALFNVTSGLENTGIGADAGRAFTTAQYATAIGPEAGYQDAWSSSLVSVDSATALGSFAQITQNGSTVIGGVYSNSTRAGIDMYAPSAFLDLPSGLGITGWSSLKLHQYIMTTTAASGTSTVVTLTFASQTFPPYKVGQLISVSGLTPSGYNGLFRVTACTQTTVTYSGTGTGAQTVAGTINAFSKPTSSDLGAFGNNLDSLFWTAPDGSIFNLTFPTIAAGQGGIYGGNGVIPSGGSTVTGTGLLTLSPNFLILSPSASTVVSTGLALSGWHNVTSGSSDAFPNGFTSTLINPASALATFTETLPNSPEDGQLVKIFFGGTIATGSPVVTALTISAPGSATIIGVAPTTATSGTCFIYQYNASSSVWYRQQ